MSAVDKRILRMPLGPLLQKIYKMPRFLLIMPVDLVVGMLLEGTFQRCPQEVEKSRQYLEMLKQRGAAAQPMEELEIATAYTNTVQPFTVEVFAYNPASGFFMARGNDRFGESGLVGSVREEEVNFHKVYVGRPPHDFPDFPVVIIRRLDVILYTGAVSLEEPLTIEGTYHIAGATTEDFDGVWSLRARSH